MHDFKVNVIVSIPRFRLLVVRSQFWLLGVTMRWAHRGFKVKVDR